ncbi:MAG: patatin-like phospholipase family protein [Vicinamibacteria bacterium]
MKRSRDDKLKRARRARKTALVCAGGGVTGAIYEMGCLRALEELLDRSVLDFDLYVGVSGGAFVASLLANGVTPCEMYEEATAHTSRPLGVSDAPLFRVDAGEFLKRSRQAPRVLSEAVVTTLTGEGRNWSDLALSLFELLPAGLLDNSGIAEYLANLAAARGHSDSFAELSRELYIVAVDLDDGEAVPFGEPAHRDVPISKAVQASTALPGLYRPVRIGDHDFVDGGVKKTAHINLAIRHGADLIVCLNPIVPILNHAGGPLKVPLAEKGIAYVLDQVLRIMLHGRMLYGMERYEAEHPEVDILLLEPSRHDMRMFSYNIMRYSARRVVAEHGYRSALASFNARRQEYAALLRRHGIELADPSRVPERPAPSPYRSPFARRLGGSLDCLDHHLRRRRA